MDHTEAVTKAGFFFFLSLFVLKKATNIHGQALHCHELHIYIYLLQLPHSKKPQYSQQQSVWTFSAAESFKIRAVKVNVITMP